MKLKLFILKYPIFCCLSGLTISLFFSAYSLINYDRIYYRFLNTGIILIALYLLLRVFEKKDFFLQLPQKEILSSVCVSLMFLNGLTFSLSPYGFGWINMPVIAKNMCIGLTEEVGFRGICFGALLLKYKNDTNGVLKAALFSSIAFAMFHLINLYNSTFNTEFIIETVGQVIFTFGFGFGFAGITYRTKSILIPFIVHSIMDIIANRSELISNNVHCSSNPMLDSILIQSYCLLLGLFGYFLIKSTIKDEISIGNVV